MKTSPGVHVQYCEYVGGHCGHGDCDKCELKEIKSVTAL